MPSWPAPERVDPPTVGGERAALEAFLDYHRATLLTKCAGLDGDQLVARSCPPSSLTLLGLVRHMAEVERSWFQRVLDGRDAPSIFCTDDDPDGDFDTLDPARADDDLAVYRREVQISREVAAGSDLDRTGWRQRTQEHVSLRWICLHMIEEYARHNGHADLLRERIDGVTGE